MMSIRQIRRMREIRQQEMQIILEFMFKHIVESKNILKLQQ